MEAKTSIPKVTMIIKINPIYIFIYLFIFYRRHFNFNYEDKLLNKVISKYKNRYAWKQNINVNGMYHFSPSQQVSIVLYIHLLIHASIRLLTFHLFNSCWQ